MPTVSLGLAVLSVLAAVWSTGSYVNDVVATSAPRLPVTILEVSASASGVVIARHVVSDTDGVFHVAYYRVGDYSGPVCEGSGTAVYEASEAERQYFSHAVWSNDPDCVNLTPGNYVIETEWTWRDRASNRTTSAKNVAKFTIDEGNPND